MFNFLFLTRYIKDLSVEYGNITTIINIQIVNLQLGSLHLNPKDQAVVHTKPLF